MKRILLNLLAMLIVASSCQKDEVEQVFLTLSEDNDIVFPFAGGESYISLSSSHNWEVSSADEWCEIFHANGNNRQGSDLMILLKVAENTESSMRETRITIASETGQSIQKNIKQAGTADVEPHMKTFIFRSSNNPLSLSSDVVCTIEDNNIHVLISHIVPSKKLIPDFSFEGKEVLVNGVVQESGRDSVDFSTPVEYTVQSGTGESRQYTVRVSSFTGLPIVFINTNGNAPIDSKDNYVDGTIRVVENFVTTTSGEMKIKGRGNSTWGLPKKPYKIKFDKKTSLLSEPADKEWVLLANYTDKTSLRNETAFFIGRLSVLDWTPRTHFVEVFINDVYNGTYQLCEQVKIANDRVSVTDDGYLMEVDQLSRLDPGDVYFQTPRLLFNIKEPDVEMDSERYNWIKNYVTNVENLLYNENFDALTGYAQYVDIPSFVDWYLINEITKNNDAIMFSSCYMHIAPNGKLKMGPLWDYDIALGNVNYNNNEKPAGLWIANAKWFAQLLKDPVFVEQVKERFSYFRSRKDDIFMDINENANYLRWSVIETNNRWQTFYTQTWPNYAIWGSYDNEVQYMKNWIDMRFDWLEQAFNEM